MAEEKPPRYTVWVVTQEDSKIAGYMNDPVAAGQVAAAALKTNPISVTIRDNYQIRRGIGVGNV